MYNNFKGGRNLEIVSNILSAWGIKVPVEEDYTVFLQKNYPDKFFFIDQCPFATNEKHCQIEILYQDLLEGAISINKFSNYEAKFINILSLLWLYNDVQVSSNISNFKLDKNQIIDDMCVTHINRLKLNFQKSPIVKVDDLKDLELLVQLCIRDLAHVEFYFQEYELLIVPSWSCFIAYFNNSEKINIVEKIINVQGLYLRSNNAV